MDTKPVSKRAGLLDDYLGEAELAAELGKNLRTVMRWRKLRVGPPFVLKGITPIYHIELARQWLAAGGTGSNKSARRRKSAAGR